MRCAVPLPPRFRRPRPAAQDGASPEGAVGQQPGPTAASGALAKGAPSRWRLKPAGRQGGGRLKTAARLAPPGMLHKGQGGPRAFSPASLPGGVRPKDVEPPPRPAAKRTCCTRESRLLSATRVSADRPPCPARPRPRGQAGGCLGHKGSGKQRPPRGPLSPPPNPARTRRPRRKVPGSPPRRAHGHLAPRLHGAAPARSLPGTRPRARAPSRAGGAGGSRRADASPQARCCGAPALPVPRAALPTCRIRPGPAAAP